MVHPSGHFLKRSSAPLVGIIGVPLQRSHGLREPAQSGSGVGGQAKRVVALGIVRPQDRRGGCPAECGQVFGGYALRVRVWFGALRLLPTF